MIHSLSLSCSIHRKVTQSRHRNEVQDRDLRRGDASLVFQSELQVYCLLTRSGLLVAYNRVALTDYFEHRNVEQLYLNKGQAYHHV